MVSGGIAEHMRGLSAALARRMDVQVVSPKQHRFGNLEWVPETTGALRRLRHVDLLHIHDTRVAYLGPLMGKPLVTTFHGYLPLEARANGASVQAVAFYEALVRFAVRASTALIAVDDRIAAWLQRYVQDDRVVHVIPNGVDVAAFRPMETRAKEHDEFPILLCAKGFMAKNGLAYAVRALPEVLAEFPDAQLTLAGFGPLQASLARLAKQLGVDANVYFPGPFPHERMPAELNFADIVLIPSVPIAGVEEATSILALEAMACARPIVASDIGGLHQMMHATHAGMLVPPADAHALAGAILILLRDDSLRERMGYVAREYVRALHTWDRVAASTMKVYEEVLRV
jgi:glycosyltransferase involved in cell wall biosynthesis